VSGPRWQRAAREVFGIGLLGHRVARSGSHMEQLHIVPALVLANSFPCPCLIRVVNHVPPSELQVSVLQFRYFKNSELTEEQKTKEK